MATIKCKMCGGNLNINEGETVAICEYCDTKQTVPTADNEKKLTLFSRANRLRAACEFDKAAGIYETIISDFPQEAEAYWGLVLCKFGIEYVDDPATGKKIPTCHRSSFESVMDDDNFDQVMENSDSVSRRVYREEAKSIENIRKGIIEVSNKEEPYDIFICYKETDENGERTLDSVIAQDIYNMLTENKYKVFFSRITLEDKLGTAYEPYIFAALNSAKVMLAIGTDYEYYNAVWVKNEWSRFLQLMSSDRKKTLIPCFKNIDAYDIPKEFKHLQAQDMGKIGAMQDLLRGIQKIIPKKEESTTVTDNPVIMDTANEKSAPLLERAFLFLEDRQWDSADEYFERVLDIEPKNAQAYTGKLLVEMNCSTIEELLNSEQVFSNSGNYAKILRFGNDALKDKLQTGLEMIIQRHNASLEAKLKAEKEEKYKHALQIYNEAKNTPQLLVAQNLFLELGDYKDSEEYANKCVNTNQLQLEYENAVSMMSSDTVHMLTAAKTILQQMNGWNDSEELINKCNIRIEQLRKKEEIELKMRMRASFEAEKKKLEKEYKTLGFFSDERRNEIEFKLYQINNKLKNL